MKREFIPKKTLGDIIALTGELPEKGERFRATKEGNQMETGLPLTVSEEGFENKDMLTVTDLKERHRDCSRTSLQGTYMRSTMHL